MFAVLNLTAFCLLILQGLYLPVEGRLTIVNGKPTNAIPPWLVVLKQDDTVHCSGSLISNRLVLTAASCIFENMHVMLASAHQAKSNDARMKSRVLQAIVPRSRSLTGGHVHDIAILRLVNSIGDQFIKLAKGPRSLDDPLHVIGFGMDETGQYSSKARYADIVEWDSTACKTAYKPFNTQINRKFNFCANGQVGKESIATCYGDGGTPAYVQGSDGDYIQIGIASFSMFNCRNRLIPPIFTRIATYRKWIDHYTGKYSKSNGIICPPGAICPTEKTLKPKCRPNYEWNEALKSCQCKLGLNCLSDIPWCERGYEKLQTCTRCNDGFFKPNPGFESCKPCPVGYYYNAATGEEAYTCFKCPENHKTCTSTGFTCFRGAEENYLNNECSSKI